jgi:hypothetical protein
VMVCCFEPRGVRKLLCLKIIRWSGATPAAPDHLSMKYQPHSSRLMSLP